MAVHEIKIPSPGESITEVEIGNWLKQDGDLVQIDESLCEIETDKATLPLVAEVSGRLKIILDQGSVANVGDVACSIDSDAAGLVQENKSASKPSAPLQEETSLIAEKKDSQETGYPKGHPSPAARKMIEERNCKFIEKHREHALHSPYWWLKCLFWKNQDDSYLVNKYHDFLVWDMMKKPFITRFLEKMLQPLIGKSTVIYFEKN